MDHNVLHLNYYLIDVYNIVLCRVDINWQKLICYTNASCNSSLFKMILVVQFYINQLIYLSNLYRYTIVWEFDFQDH